MKNTTKFVIGVSAAAAAGAAIALVFAPQKGSILRTTIQDLANNYSNKLLSTIQREKDTLLEEGKKLATKAGDKLAEEKSQILKQVAAAN